MTLASSTHFPKDHPKSSDSLCELEKAAVTWEVRNGAIVVLSRFEDDNWEGAAEGVLAAAPRSGRTIQFSRVPSEWRECAKRILYASQRHPIRISRTPAFATLLKKYQAITHLFVYLNKRGITPINVTKDDIKRYLLQRSKSVEHQETLISTLGTLRGAAIHYEQGLLSFDLRYPYPTTKGAKSIASYLWRESHGKEFDGEGILPYDDDDLTLIMRGAYLYTEELGPHICAALETCIDIAMQFPDRRVNRTLERIILRKQVSFLNSYNWPQKVTHLSQWPPRNFSDLLEHARLCTAAAAISISFAIGARRSEVNSITDDCICEDSKGQPLLILTQFKGKDEKNGVQIKLPIDNRVISAVNLQKSIKKQIFRRVTETSPEEKPKLTDKLFVQLGYRCSDDQHGNENPDGRFYIKGGQISSGGLSSTLLTFKRSVVPLVDGSINFTRFRKSVARLVTLSMEGAPLILQLLFGHSSYKVTLGYMFASPMILEEVATTYPEFLSRNLKTLYQEQTNLMGGGANSLKAAILTGTEVGMTEEEFVSLGLEMMESGQMILNIIGKGTYCLKPLMTRGPCNNDPAVLLPNIGRCDPLCNHHLILGRERPRLIREIRWLQSKIESPESSTPIKKYYQHHHDLLMKVISKT